MKRVPDLAMLTAGTPCPECGLNTLEFTLRCDLEYHGCIYTAHCRSCRLDLEIVASDGEPDPSHLSEAIEPCEECGGREWRASLHCEVATRTCIYRLECAGCHRDSRTNPPDDSSGGRDAGGRQLGA